MLTLYHRRPTLAAFLAGLLCVVVDYGFAQAPASLQHQSWSTEAGLPQTSVHQILQSRDGYLWLATEGGVVRYDGMSFKTFSHETDPTFTSNDVTSLAEDRDGNLWFGTADGLIENAKGRLQRLSQSDGMPTSSVLSLAPANDGSIFVLTGGGLVSYDGAHFRPLQNQPSSIDRLQPEADGSVILVTSEGLLRFKDSTIQPLTFAELLPHSVLRGVSQNQSGAIWLWSDHEALSSFQGRQSLWRIGHDLPGARIQSLFVDRRGVAWIGTNRGLVTVTASSQQPTPIPALGANSILSIMEDAEGNLWIGTETSGLHTLRPRKFREEPALADDEVSSVVQASDGSMWIGTRDDGLRRLRPTPSGNKLDRPVPNDALTSPVILSLAPGLHGDVWAGTPDGLTHVEASGRATRYTSSDGLPDDLVRSLLAARDGSLWIGTRRGLAHLQSGHFDIKTQANGLGGDLIGTLFESGNDLWIGTLSGLSLLRDGLFTNFTQADGLGSKLVTSLTEDDTHRLWVSTRDAGLFLFDGHRFLAISVKGMPQEIFSIVADRQGFLWLRGPHGVVRASAAELAQCATQPACQPTLGAYGVEDRMPSEELVPNGSPSAWRTSSGELWFATRKGVAITDPANLPVNIVSPPVVIERFLADNDALPLAANPQSLPSGHARYTFEFAGLSYTVPSKVLYRSKLEGFDRDWSDASTRRNASYTNLPPGTYTFRVQAANNDGLWNNVGAQVQFRILPPIYRRWWFLLAVLLALTALSILLYRLRVRRLHQRFDAVLAERNRIAREIHDTLAQDFVGVSLQLDLVSQLLALNDLPEAKNQLKETRSLVKAGLEEARQSIWNLRANTTRDGLPARVTALAQRFPVGDLVLKTKIGGAYRALSSSLEDEVFRIMQEAISNVQRHAAATAINVQLIYRHDKLVVTVEDNGRGFPVPDAAAKPGHFGLQGMQERAASISAKLNVTSSPGEGTVVELVVPVTDRKGSQR
jgi:signal transduction histidine kinase/ligand-binding sensor domain-containing protein